MKMTVAIIPTNLVANLILSLFFCPFIETKKQESNFQEIGGLVTRNSFAFHL